MARQRRQGAPVRQREISLMRFILVHGGFHGAWCWDRLVPELAALGHEALALDLPGHGERAAERPSTYAERVAPIVDAMRDGDVLVGHSGGGYDICLAYQLAAAKAGHLMFLAAGLPIEGKSVVEATGGAVAEEDDARATKLMDDATGMLRFIRPLPDGTMEWISREGAREFFYHDCSEADADWAFSRLSPGISPFPQEKLHLPRLWADQPPRSYIQCDEDRAKPHSMSDEVIRRLGVTPLRIAASHSPFLSKPRELAALMVQALDTVPVGPLLPN
jgi:pimeloyl-ACP methyl ester carboxylesterase